MAVFCGVLAAFSFSLSCLCDTAPPTTPPPPAHPPEEPATRFAGPPDPQGGGYLPWRRHWLPPLNPQRPYRRALHRAYTKLGSMESISCELSFLGRRHYEQRGRESGVQCIYAWFGREGVRGVWCAECLVSMAEHDSENKCGEWRGIIATLW